MGRFKLALSIILGEFVIFMYTDPRFSNWETDEPQTQPVCQIFALREVP